MIRGTSNPKLVWRCRFVTLQDAYNVKMKKVFPVTVMGHSCGGFQMTENWLHVIILHHLRKMNYISFMIICGIYKK